MKEETQTKGNFKWSKRGNVIFEPNPNGRWTIVPLPNNDKSKEINQVNVYRHGIDPIQEKL